MTHIERLQKHIKSRRGRRDFQALNRLVDLKTRRKPGTLRSMDALLKCYYTETASLQQSYGENPMFAFLKKEPAHSNLIVGVDYSIKETTIMLARCPDCDELIEITPNGADPAKTNKRQRLVMHSDKRTGALCVGAGKDI